jgi:predicted ATPase/DNA-binding SARP family transcriptional activator
MNFETGSLSWKAPSSYSIIAAADQDQPPRQETVVDVAGEMTVQPRQAPGVEPDFLRLDLDLERCQWLLAFVAGPRTIALAIPTTLLPRPAGKRRRPLPADAGRPPRPEAVDPRAHRRAGTCRMAGMASDLRVGILGPLELRVGFGEPVAVVGTRLRTLLIRLALDPDRVVLASQLVDAVWDADPPAAAINALQSLVSRLRRLLPDVVKSHAAGYRLALEPEAVDAVRFERMALAGRERLREDPLAARELLREALALWRGPALADAAGARFAGAAIARLEELRLGATEDRIDAELLTGPSDALVAELDELATAHPLRERLHGQLMRALSASQRPADALGSYERLRRRLADELGIDPSEEVRAIHLAVLRGDLTAGPDKPHAPTPPKAARAEQPPRSNLRAQITSFVGRGSDIARIEDLLARWRLVTLTGPGGAGKTRLAIEAGAGMLDRMPDGVWMVELAPVADPLDLPRAVLSLLGARELGLLARRGSGAVPPIERIVQAIGDKHLLLVLDNCEHLVAAAADFADLLLARCASLRVLTTSREPLGITGEALHPVGPLAMPDEEVTPAEALRYPAVRLFADRAAAGRPGFVVEEATVGPVLRICRALDGIPLAIELAAARLRALSPDQIAARLDDRFRLLAGGSRAALPRHQTLRAVVDWSWDLLSDAERILARRLAVFPGGATLDAVEQVCADPALGGLARDEVIYLVAALVEKSLVVADEGGAEVRYWMLETVRAYGEERRREAGEDHALRGAHAAYFLRLAEEAEPHLRMADQLVWLDRLSAEQENLRAALHWAIDERDALLALRLVAGLDWYWFLRSARAEGSELSAQALALPGSVPKGLLARVLVMSAMVSITGGTGIERSLAFMDRAAGLVAELPSDDLHLAHPALALLPVLAAILRGDDGAALDQARSQHDHPDAWVRALVPLGVAQLLINLGEAGEAQRQLDLALERFSQLGERWGIGQTLFARVELSAMRGDERDVAGALMEAEQVLAGIGGREDIGQIKIRLALAHARAGDLAAAERELAVAEGLAEAIGSNELRVYVLLTRSQIARWQGNLGEARRLADAGFEMFESSWPPFEQFYALLLAARGHVSVEIGDLGGAHDWYQRSLKVAVKTRDRPVIARAVELLAAIAGAEGDPERSATLLGQAAALRGIGDEADPDVLRVRAAARAALGDEGFALAYERGTAWRRENLVEALTAEVTSSGGTPAASAGRTPA